MRAILIGLLAATAVSGCADTGYGSRMSSNDGYRNYDWNRPDPSYGGYNADRYYREDRNRRERRLARDERVYRGQDGRYYCRRSDGTTGLIVGGVAGGILGNIIAPGGSEVLGTVLGAAAGAAAGSAVDRGSNKDVRCR